MIEREEYLLGTESGARVRVSGEAGKAVIVSFITDGPSRKETVHIASVVLSEQGAMALGHAAEMAARVVRRKDQ